MGLLGAGRAVRLFALARNAARFNHVLGGCAVELPLVPLAGTLGFRRPPARIRLGGVGASEQTIPQAHAAKSNAYPSVRRESPMLDP